MILKLIDQLNGKYNSLITLKSFNHCASIFVLRTFNIVDPNGGSIIPWEMIC